MPRPRVLLYCHNAVGLGHVVRTLRIAEALVATEAAEVMLLTGCRWLEGVTIPVGVTVRQLPPARMEGLRLVGANDGDPHIITTRTARIRSALDEFRPDTVLVDHLALGLGGEWAELLADPAFARDAGGPLFVWGLRDIVYNPAFPKLAPRPPRNPRMRAALERYDAALAYSQPDWIDPFAALSGYPLPDQRMYAGIVSAPMPSAATPDPAVAGAAGAEATDADHGAEGEAARRPLVVGLAGSGGAGTALFELFFAMIEGLRAETEGEEAGNAAVGGEAGAKPPSQPVRARVVVGPFGDVATARARGAALGVEVWAEGDAGAATSEAAVIVSQAGYNTAYQIIHAPARILFVPAINDSLEQIHRAEKLAELEGVEWLDPRAPDAMERLTDGVRSALRQARTAPDRPPRALPFAIDGAAGAARALLAIHAEATA